MQQPSITPQLAASRLRGSVVHDVIEASTDAWKPNIVLLLWLGRVRFTELAEGLGMSRSTLAQRLAQLVEDGCVQRAGGGAERAGYVLTPKGRGLVGITLLNRQWNTRWLGGNVLLPGLRLQHRCGAPLTLQVLCGHCDREVRARDVKVLQIAPPAPAGKTAAQPYRRSRNHRASAQGALARGEELAGDRWTSLVLAMSFMGLRRNSEIEEAIGIAPNILADRLAWLTANGIFDRVPYQSSPERHEYRLTPKGLDRYPVILAMMLWGEQWMGARAPLDWAMLHKPCHEWLAPRLACQACRADFDPGSTRQGETSATAG